MPEAVAARVRLDVQSYRFIPSHFPPIPIFENLLDPEDLEAAYQLESLTNDRLRSEAGEIAMVAEADRLVGPGTSPIMAAFTHVGIASRFTDGRYGVYYAGLDRDTALEEARQSRARFLSATAEGPQELTMRCIRCRVAAEMADLRGNRRAHARDDYAYSQRLGARLREAGERGILYRSVRRPGGECIAVLRPPALKPPAVQAGHYRFHWNGRDIDQVFEMRQLR